MIIDLKVLVRSSDCDAHSYNVSNPRGLVFFFLNEFAKVTFYLANVSQK